MIEKEGSVALHPLFLIDKNWNTSLNMSAGIQILNEANM